VKFPLEGKVVIVSGAAQGLGAAAARSICEAGGKALVADTLDEVGLSLVEDMNREAAGEVTAYAHLDVCSADAWNRAVEKANRTFGKVTGLVNIAGVPPGSPIDETTDEEWSRTIDFDLKGAWLGMKAVIPAIRRTGAGGSIVNASSHYGLIASDRAFSLHTAEGALAMLTKAAAAEYARENIRVNCIQPGLTDAMLDSNMAASRREALLRRVPMGRLARASEIGSALVFLLSDLSSYMTGASVVIDGGLTAT
jgi:NAD(P)-dependent dehydrogenase (short-subunit alcohol dehydrogenase family)